jgi:hypothetical protein
VLLALVALTCALSAPHARAQSLQDSVIESGTPDQAAIDAYVKQYFDNLAKPEATAKARKGLADPLQRTTRPSVAFRRAYSQAIRAKVAPLTKDANDDVAVNAVRLTGLMGTQEGLEDAEGALDDKRESVRIAAAGAIGVSLASMGAKDDATPLLSRNATDALDRLNAALSKETSPRVLDAIIQAIENALHLPVSATKAAGVPSRAMDILLRQGNELARKLSGPEFDGLFGHIAKALSDAIAQDEKFTDAQKIQAAGVAGDIIARVFHRIDPDKSSEIPDAQRTELALVVEQAELIIKYKGKSYGLGALIRAAKDTDFRERAAKLFDALRADPFNLTTPPDRFPKNP